MSDTNTSAAPAAGGALDMQSALAALERIVRPA